MWSSSPACSARIGARNSGRPLHRARGACSLTRRTIEADRTRKFVTAGGGQPGMAPAKAEADGEDGLASSPGGRAEVVDGGADILFDSFEGGLCDVVHVWELVTALADAGGAPEVVEGDCGVPPLGEAKRELLVEAVQAADVRQDDDADPRAVVKYGSEGGEARPVGCLERDVLGEDGRPARERRDRRHGVEFEAHVFPTIATRHVCRDTERRYPPCEPP